MGKKVLKSLLAAYVVTGILLLLLTILLYKFELGEQKVTAGIVITYVISSFVGGFLLGKWMKERKFIWGLTLGILYFGLLLLVSLVVYRTLGENGANILAAFLLCAGGGMFGGMVS